MIPNMLIEWTRHMGKHGHSVADVFHREAGGRLDDFKATRFDAPFPDGTGDHSRLGRG